MEVELTTFGVRVQLNIEPTQPTNETEEAPKAWCWACGAEAYLIISPEEVKLYCEKDNGGCDSAYMLTPPTWASSMRRERVRKERQAKRDGIPEETAEADDEAPEVEEETPEADPEPWTAAAALETDRTALESRLRSWRREEAVKRGVPTYIIMTERTIQAIVESPPSTKEGLGNLKGVGPKTMDLYGDHLVALIAEKGAA